MEKQKMGRAARELVVRELHELGLGNPLVTCAMVVFEIRMLHINKVTRKYRPFFLRFEINIVVVIKVSLD